MASSVTSARVQPQTRRLMRSLLTLFRQATLASVCLGVLISAFYGHDASASCGYYLMPSDHQLSQDSTSLTIDYLLTGRTPRKQRCHGPGCSQSPQVPPLMSVKVVSSPRVELAVMASNDCDDTANLPFSSIGVYRKSVRDYVAEIFRPPCDSLALS